MKKNLSTKENREFWEYVEKTAKKVDSWPDSIKSSSVFGNRTVPEKEARKKIDPTNIKANLGIKDD